MCMDKSVQTRYIMTLNIRFNDKENGKAQYVMKLLWTICFLSSPINDKL